MHTGGSPLEEDLLHDNHETPKATSGLWNYLRLCVAAPHRPSGHLLVVTAYGRHHQSRQVDIPVSPWLWLLLTT
jgi:hypothetical protein